MGLQTRFISCFNRVIKITTNYVHEYLLKLNHKSEELYDFLQDSFLENINLDNISKENIVATIRQKHWFIKFL